MDCVLPTWRAAPLSNFTRYDCEKSGWEVMDIVNFHDVEPAWFQSFLFFWDRIGQRWEIILSEDIVGTPGRISSRGSFCILLVVAWTTHTDRIDLVNVSTQIQKLFLIFILTPVPCTSVIFNSTNDCTILILLLHIITHDLLPHVSTLMRHLQGAFCVWLKLHILFILIKCNC